MSTEVLVIYKHLSTTVVSCSVPDAPIASWEFSRGNLAIERVIGHGAFGMVSKAYARDLPGKPDWTIVAVKSLQGKQMFNNIMGDKLLTIVAVKSLQGKHMFDNIMGDKLLTIVAVKSLQGKHMFDNIMGDKLLTIVAVKKLAR